MKGLRFFLIFATISISTNLIYAQDYLGKTKSEVTKIVEKKTDDFVNSTSEGFDNIWFGIGGRNGATFLMFNKEGKCFLELIMTMSKNVAESFIYDNYNISELNNNDIPSPSPKEITLLHQTKRNPFGGVNYCLYLYDDTDYNSVKEFFKNRK